jgi:integrase/recombinase XerD
LGQTPIQSVQETNVWGFIDREMAVCGSLRTLTIKRIEGVTCKAKLFKRTRQVPATCSALCPKYVPRNPSVIHHALKALNSFFRFLVRRGHVSHNFLPEVAREFSRDYPLRKFLKKRRQPTLEEVRLLVSKTVHPTRKMFYALVAKTGFRIHEALLLTEDSIDFQARTIRIPVPESGPNKRRGKRLGFVDDELMAVVRSGLDYRAGLLARRLPERRPKALFIGDNGRPVSPNLVDTDWLREDTVRLGLVGDPLDPEERITAHCLRHFFTSALMRRKCPETYIHHLRGDVIKDIIGTYHDPSEQELRAVYFEYFPTIGL